MTEKEKIEIAQHGHKLEILKNDEDCEVREIANKLLKAKTYNLSNDFGTYKGNLFLYVWAEKYEIESGCYTTSSLDEWHERCTNQLDLETADEYSRMMKELVRTV